MKQPYDIRLSLSKEEADLLLYSLESYALEMHNLSTYTGNADALKIVELVDNIVATIASSMAEQEKPQEELQELGFVTSHDWWYCKGG